MFFIYFRHKQGIIFTWDINCFQISTILELIRNIKIQMFIITAKINKFQVSTMIKGPIECMYSMIKSN